MSRRFEGRNIVNIGSQIILKVPHNKKSENKHRTLRELHTVVLPHTCCSKK